MDPPTESQVGSAGAKAQANESGLTLHNVSFASKLLEKRRQMFEAQEALDAQKKSSKEKEMQLQQREASLKQRDQELQDSLIKFNKFLQDNDTKRARAEKKERDEIRLRMQKEQEIKRLTSHLQHQREQQSRMAEELERMIQYSDYLESVLEVDNEFPEIEDLISRYETLEAAQRNLMAQSAETGQHQESLRSQLQSFVREKTDEQLGFNNRIAELQKESDAAAADAVEAKKQSERNATSVAESKLQLGQVVMACENIYQRCCNHSTVRRKSKPLPSDTNGVELVRILIDRLSFIRDYILDMTDISKNFKKVEPLDSSPGSRSVVTAPVSERFTVDLIGGSSVNHSSTPPASTYSGKRSVERDRKSRVSVSVRSSQVGTSFSRG